jgi:hypothetical protein
MVRLYILNGHEPVPVRSISEWGRWFEKANRVVRLDALPGGVGKPTTISTVFLGVDHSWGDGPPLIFETMIFGGPHNKATGRCSTWAEAMNMHRSLCALARTGLSLQSVSCETQNPGP